MHIQSSLVLSLTAASVLAYETPVGYAQPTIKPHGNSTSNSTSDAESKYLAYLKEQVSSLKGELSSKSEACATTSSVDAEVSRDSSAGTAPATYDAAWTTGIESSISRLEPTTTRSYTYVSDNGNFTSPLGPTGTGFSSSSVVLTTGGAVTPSSSAVAGSSNSSSIAITSSASSSTVASSSTLSSSSTSTKVPATYVPQLSDFTAEQIASGEAWKNVSDLAISRMQDRQADSGCTYENAVVRTEFRSMSNAERKSFTDAITCLQQTAPRNTAAGSETYPGVMDRYDEYVATHINDTYHIHGTADFLAWHRNFIFEWEQDLINTCGYTGSLPYWDWARDAEAVDQSELFNGDEFSMGGNGEYIAGRDDTFLGLMGFSFPPGTGGGCVMEGPFSNSTTFETHLGPIDSPYDNNVANQFDLNTRCLVRDLNSWFSSQFNTYTNVTDLVLGETDVQYFQSLMQGFLGDNKLGVHGGGHWLGGGPSQLEDFHSSPNDPIFFLHHAMIDRIWTVWQYLDLEKRQDEIYGTSTLLNSPASADMSLTDSLSFGLVAEDKVFGDLMDTLAGPFCYRYD